MTENNRASTSDEKDQENKDEKSVTAPNSLSLPGESEWQTVGSSRESKPQRDDHSRGRGQGARQNARPARRRGRGQGRGPTNQSPAPQDGYSGEGTERAPSKKGRARGGPRRGQGRGPWRGQDRGSWTDHDRGPSNQSSVPQEGNSGEGTERAPGRAGHGRPWNGHDKGSFNQSSASQNRYFAEGTERAPNMEGRGKGEWRGHPRGGFGGGRGRPHGKRGSNYQSGATEHVHQPFDKMSHGYTRAGVWYERNKLYVLGLHYKTTKDGVQNYIERISGDDVKHVLMFKPNGKAIVTLNKISDFASILREAEKKKLEGLNVLIERAPVCKSIFVSGFHENTSQEDIGKYFDCFGGVEKVVPDDKPVKRAIVYFKNEKGLKRIFEKDHFLENKPLHVERFYPFMGTVEPIDNKKRMPRSQSTESPGSEHPYFHKKVDSEIMEFVMSKSNQAVELKERLFSEHALSNWSNNDGYVLIRHNLKGPKLDEEFEESVWRETCSEIVDDVLARFAARKITVEEQTWEAVIDQLPQIEGLFPKYTAQVKKNDEMKCLNLICPIKDLSEFEGKLKTHLQEIKRKELEKTFDRKTRTDISSEKLKLLHNARFETIWKDEIHQDIQARIELKTRSLFVTTPHGEMVSAISYLNQRLEEIDKNSTKYSPEILNILKTKVGIRKLREEFKEAKLECAFNVDEKKSEVLFLGRAPTETVKGKDLAVTVLINDKLILTDRDNNLMRSEKWKDLCKKLEKKLKILYEHRLTELHVFGFKKDVVEAVKKMRDFLNEKKATEGEFRFDSIVHRRCFNEVFKAELKQMEDELSMFSVKIKSDDVGLRFTGTEEGVKVVEERLDALQDEIENKHVSPESVPGMRSFLAQDGRGLISTVEREHMCVIDITEVTGDQHDEVEMDSDDQSSLASNGGEFDEDDDTLRTPEGKNVIWKTGNLEEEEADILVCSVGSNLNLSIGAIARAMSKVAGSALQDDLRKKANHLNEGEVIYTIPGQLPCRHVIHCVCSPWNSGKSGAEQILERLLWKCFEKASELGACSIGVPLIGTGNLGYPYDVAVQIMIDAAFNYSRANDDTSLEEFRFIVYSGDQEGISTFEEKFGELKEEQRKKEPSVRSQSSGNKKRKSVVLRERSSASPASSNKEVCIGDLKVKITKADITKESSDGIFNVVLPDLDMHGGNLRAAIAKASGDTVQEELKTKPPQCSGSVVITAAGELPAKYILHMVVAPGNRRHLQTCLEKGLKEADSQGMTSVSIPAVGSGGLGLSAEESAELVLGAVSAFATSPSSVLREVRVVVFDDPVVGAFIDELEAILRANGEETCEEEDDKIYGEENSQAVPEKSAVTVVVYGRQGVLDSAVTALKEGVTRACETKSVTHEIVGRLPKQYIRDLKRMSRDRDVNLENSDMDVITLRGLPKDVAEMNSEVWKVIQKRTEEEHQEQRAEQMARTVQWHFFSVKGKREPFDNMANYEIETAFKANKPSVVFTSRNCKAELNFGNYEVTFVKKGAIKRVYREDVIPLPSEWIPQPLDVNGREEDVYLVPLAQDSHEFKTVETEFNNSLLGKKLSITSIKRIQNPSLYKSYMTKKQTMDEKNGNFRNEMLLFHGTKYDSVKAINVQGFNRSFCGLNGAVYGDGVYFATRALTSFTYSLPSPRGDLCMFLARVLVGRYVLGKQGMRTPPIKDPSKSALYDSVVNDMDDPAIFVIFHDCQCYPKYLITFKKSTQ